METAARLGDFKALKQLLEERLQSEQILAIPFQIQCALQHGKLLILTQHAAPALSNNDVEPIFNTLEQTIQRLQPEFTKQIRLYLRVVGQKQPYAVRDFELKTPVLSTAEAATGLENGHPFAAADDGIHHQAYQNGSTPEDYSDDMAASEAFAFAPKTGGQPFESSYLDEPTPEPEVVSRQTPTRRTQSAALPVTLIAAAAGVAGVLLLGSLYVVTRPCVIGPCNALQTAQQLSQESAKTLQLAKSAQDVAEVHKQLDVANQQLSDIPPWSPHYDSAQTLLQSISMQSQPVDRLLTAFNRATIASQKSQNPPHPVQRWQETQALWIDAIAQLKQIPESSPAYQLAQEKLADYQLNLATINQRLKTEQQSEQRLAEAKQTAQVAEARQENAQTLDNWQQVYSSWQTAVNALASIPKISTFYPQAQQLLESYRPQLATARDRRTKEQISVNNYNQAVSLAALARRLEQQSQWAQAVATWRQAVNYIEQVPKETFYSSQAQSLAESYANSLRQSEEKLRVSLVLQKARADLERTCSGSPRICDYVVAGNGIKVYLTPSYVNRVMRTAATADLRGDYNTMVGLQDHLKTLQVALEAISQNASLPMELYDHRRSLIGKYAPR